MMPERLALTDPNTQVTEVIGSGPFRFARGEWIPGAKVVYEKFVRYQPRAEPPSQAAGGKLVKIDRVEMLYTPDAATATSGLLTGELDVLESPAPDLIQRMQRSPDVVVTPNDPLGYQLFCVINHTQPPFDRVEIRRVLLAALSQSDHMQATVGERTPWRECGAVFGCGPNDAVQRAELGWPAENRAAASAALRAAGYDGKPVVVLDPADNATLHPNALLLADALKRVGFNVDLQAMDWATVINRRASRAPVEQGGWNLFITNATLTGIANPLLNNYVRQCEEAWYGWPCDPRIPALTRDWTFEADPARRQSMLKRIEALHIESVTQVPLGQYRSFIAHRKSLRGLIPGPALFYWNLEKG
jgi:peptide/nickel transport system substrate-binding protein